MRNTNTKVCFGIYLTPLRYCLEMLAHASSYVQYWYFKVHLGNCALGGIPSLSWINKPVSVTLPLGKNAFQDRDNEPRVSWPAVGWVVVVTAAGCGGAGWMEVKTDVLEPLPYHGHCVLA